MVYLPGMDHETKVKLYVEDDPGHWIACAIVQLFDRDRISPDDRLGMNITNTYGEAIFRFHTDDFLDIDDRIGGALPELYVKVFDSDGTCVHSTRAEAQRNAVPHLIRVPIPRETAERFGLI